MTDSSQEINPRKWRMSLVMLLPCQKTWRRTYAATFQRIREERIAEWRKCEAIKLLLIADKRRPQRFTRGQEHHAGEALFSYYSNFRSPQLSMRIFHSLLSNFLILS
jgi:hypothetical protein